MATALTPDQRAFLDALRGPKGPRIFFEQVLGEKLDEQQYAVLDAFASSRRVSVKSGHSCGKDWLFARLALWFHCTHYPSIVVTTAPTDRQVRHVIWGEIRAAYRKAKVPIGGELLPDSPYLKSGDPHHYMIGFKAKNADSFQGFHVSGENAGICILISEATGIEQRLWPAIESLMTAPNAKMALIGNALMDPESEFYQSFTSKAHLYEPVTLDSEKSSYCSKDYIEDIRSTFGEGSPMWMARVKGEFPVDAADVLIPLGWIEAAAYRWEPKKPGDGQLPGLPEEPDTLGVDVARFGSDRTVVYHGRNCRFRPVRDRQGQDLMATCGDVVDCRRELSVDPKNIRVDDTGLGGGVTDRLRELGHDVTAINFGGKAAEEEKFANVRSEMFWALRERFRSGRIAIDPKDRMLVGDLSQLKYKLTSRGQIKLEDKSELKKRSGRSPDRADSLALAALAPPLAADLSTGRITNAGIMEWMKLRAAEKQASPAEALAKVPVAQVSPDSARLLEISREQVRGPVPDPDAFFHR